MLVRNLKSFHVMISLVDFRCYISYAFEHCHLKWLHLICVKACCYLSKEE